MLVAIGWTCANGGCRVGTGTETGGGRVCMGVCHAVDDAGIGIDVGVPDVAGICACVVMPSWYTAAMGDIVDVGTPASVVVGVP